MTAFFRTSGWTSAVHVFLRGSSTGNAPCCVRPCLLQLKTGREREDLPASLCFSPEEAAFLVLLCRRLEGRTEKQKNPFRPGSLAYAAWVLGRLGGWKGLYSQGPPGVRSFARGLHDFEQQYQGFQMVRDMLGESSFLN